MTPTNTSAPRTLGELLGLNGVAAGLSFVTTIALANALGPATFGEYVFFVACGQYLLVFGQFGTPRTLVRDIVRHRSQAAKLSAGALLLGGVGLGISAVIGAGVLSRTGVLTLGGVLVAAGVGLRGLDLAGAFDAAGLITTHARLSVATRLAYLAGVWVLLLGLPRLLGLTALGVAMLATSVALLALQVLRAPFALAIPAIEEVVLAARAMGRRNRWLLIAALAALTSGSFSKIVMRPLAGAEALGAFGAAWQIVVAGSLVTSQIVRVGAPKLAALAVSSRMPALRHFLVRYAVVNTGAACAVALPVVLFPTLVTDVMFDVEYAGVAEPMRLLGIMVVVTAIGQLASQYLIMVGRDRATSMVAILTAILGPALFFLLIPDGKAVGASWAVLITSLVSTLILVALLAMDLRARGRLAGGAV